MVKTRYGFNGVLAWVTLTGVMLVGFSILLIALLESQIVEQASKSNRQAEFLRAAQFISETIGKTGGIRNVEALQDVIRDILEIRPGIRRLSVFDLTPESSTLIYSTDPLAAPQVLSVQERNELAAGRLVMQFDETMGERAWRITAPITVEGRLVGALRGLFSMKKYDELMRQQIDLVRVIGIGAVAVTSLAFLLLIRVKIHRPIHRLLNAMRRVETGDLSGQAPVTGPSEIQQVAGQFNSMLDRVRKGVAEKDRLLGDIQNFNTTLQKRISEATEELHQANLELVEARIQVERAQTLAALGELSAVVAHELGNPMNALSGHLQMLARASDSNSRRRHLAVIQSEIDRMVVIIKHLLDSTRVPLRPAPVDLNGVINDVLALLSTGLPRQHITVKTDLKSNLPPVRGDQRALHGMVFNLINNAVQAMPTGGELDIQTRDVSGEAMPGTVIVNGAGCADAAAVRLTIRDTGKGISPDHLSRIFDPFFTTRHDEGGTGLGLAMCHRVVTSSNGRLAVKSVEGHGAQFTIDFPVWSEETGRRKVR